MKKLLAGLSLVALLVGGFAFVQDNNATDLTMDREPTIYGTSSTTVQF
ncbi:hypothetical protein [Oceanobacillus damuensis]|nr:hypothetical protein [Oceanobacillus damuensis]